MEKDALIKELNQLWEPIRPYLSRQIEELYGRRDGHILEIGPFSGTIFHLVQNGIGRTFMIAAFPQAAVHSCQHEAHELGLQDRVRIVESDSALNGIADESVDLAIFRGALFFPSLFRADLGAVNRTLRAGAIAFVGGGFGKYTPAEVISRIAKPSEQLNLAMGRVRITVESVREQVHSSNLTGEVEVITEGGLWVVIRR